MLAGIRPWIDEPPSDVLFRQRFELLPSLGDLRTNVPHRLRAVIERAVAKDRNDQWFSAVAMLSALTDDEWVPEEPAPSHQAAAQARLTAATEPPAPPSVANPTPVHTMVYRRGMTPPPAALTPQPDAPARPAPERSTAPYAEGEGRQEEPPPLWQRPYTDRRPWLIAVPVILIGAVVVGLAIAGPSSITHYLPGFGGEGGQSDSAARDSAARVAPSAAAHRAGDSAAAVAAAVAAQRAADNAAADSADRAIQFAVMRDSIRRLDSIAKMSTKPVKARPDTFAAAAHGPNRLLAGIATNASPAPLGRAGPAPASTAPSSAAPPPPAQIVPPLPATVAAGGTHTCALNASGGVACWGGNDRGQLGVGGDAHAPAPTPLGAGPFTEVAAGLTHTCGVLRAGGIECWGENDYGQLGDSTLNAHSLPQHLAGSGARSYRFVAVGMAHSCALASNGDVFCWGRNSYGQLGDGSVTNGAPPCALPAARRSSRLPSDGITPAP